MPWKKDDRGRVDPTAPLEEHSWLTEPGAWDSDDGRGTDLPSRRSAWALVSIARKIRDFLFGSGKAIWDAINKLGNWAIDIGNAVKDAILRIGVFFARVGHYFAMLYTRVLRPLVVRFFDLVKAFAYFLRNFFKPVVDFLLRVRKELLDIYRLYVKPVLDLLDVFQSFLRILEALHIGWAKKLDAWIDDLERRINEPFQYVLAKLNELITFVNRVITLDGLLTRIAHLQTQIRDAKYTANLWWNTMHRALSAEERARAAEPAKTKAYSERESEVRQYITTRDGPLRARVEESATNIMLIVKRGAS